MLEALYPFLLVVAGAAAIGLVGFIAIYGAMMSR